MTPGRLAWLVSLDQVRTSLCHIRPDRLGPRPIRCLGVPFPGVVASCLQVRVSQLGIGKSFSGQYRVETASVMKEMFDSPTTCTCPQNQLTIRGDSGPTHGTFWPRIDSRMVSGSVQVPHSASFICLPRTSSRYLPGDGA